VDYNFFASLREEKNMARKAAKPQRPPEVKQSGPQFLYTSLPRRKARTEILEQRSMKESADR
jgi:hypothetical protein